MRQEYDFDASVNGAVGRRVKGWSSEKLELRREVLEKTKQKIADMYAPTAQELVSMHKGIVSLLKMMIQKELDDCIRVDDSGVPTIIKTPDVRMIASIWRIIKAEKLELTVSKTGGWRGSLGRTRLDKQIVRGEFGLRAYKTFKRSRILDKINIDILDGFHEPFHRSSFMRSIHFIQETSFKEIIRPFLKNEPDKHNYTYFREQAYRLWVLHFSKQDAEKVVALQEAYAELYAKDPTLFINLTNRMFSKLHDCRTNVESSAWEYDLLSHDDKTQMAFKKGFEYYKSLFESEFALWISLFYAWIIECHKPTLKIGNIDYVSVPASQKRKTLGDQKFPMIIDGIDHKIRNAGSGHESWEITDEDECVYKDIDQRTGETKETFQISISELREKIKKIEKATAIIDLSLHVFLANNPTITVGYSALGIRPKISEIERMTSKMASDYQLNLRKFQLGKDRGQLDLEIFHPKQAESVRPSQVFTNLWAHEVVTLRWGVSYIDQVFGILFWIIHLNEGKAFNLHLKIVDEEVWDIYEGEFDAVELQKWADEASKEKTYPKPKEWGLPEKSYTLVAPFSVQFWLGNEIQAIIDNPIFTKKYKDTVLAIYGV